MLLAQNGGVIPQQLWLENYFIRVTNSTSQQTRIPALAYWFGAVLFLPLSLFSGPNGI